jgi:hypothetical protein
MFPCGSPSLVVLLFSKIDVGPPILFLVFPLLCVLWFLFDWQGFLIKHTLVRQGKRYMSQPKLETFET